MIDNIEKTNQQVWKKSGVTYLPHYTKPDGSKQPLTTEILAALTPKHIETIKNILGR